MLERTRKGTVDVTDWLVWFLCFATARAGRRPRALRVEPCRRLRHLALTLRLHTKGAEKPIWVARANGKATEDGMKTTFCIDDVSAETKLFLKASGTAMDKFGLYKGE